MKLQLHLNQQTHAADFTIKDSDAQLTIADQLHTAQLIETEPNIFTVIIHNQVYACAVEKSATGITEIIVNGNRIAVGIQDPKRLSHNAAAQAQAGGRAVLTSPMPGKIVRVMCHEGDIVTEGQGLLVVEAMKMQNEVQAPKDGQVITLKVTEGQTVNAGETLAIIE